MKNETELDCSILKVLKLEDERKIQDEINKSFDKDKIKSFDNREVISPGVNSNDIGSPLLPKSFKLDQIIDMVSPKLSPSPTNEENRESLQTL